MDDEGDDDKGRWLKETEREGRWKEEKLGTTRGEMESRRIDSSDVAVAEAAVAAAR